MRLLAYTGSTVFISLWTVLRFFTQKTIFDLVGQQVLAQQLLHGGIAGAGIGVTNYIPKLLFLYVPLHLLPGSPRIKLLLLTLAVNITTIVLLGLVLERILRKFGVKAGPFLWIGLLWLSMIAGSVFWIQFTNSRNLEVVGGVFLLYQGVCYVERSSWRRLVAVSLFATVLFFADTLQAYMSAIPLILYGMTVAIRSRSFRAVSLLSVSVVAAYIASGALLTVCAWLFSIHFVQNGGGLVIPSAHNLLPYAVNSLRALIHLYSGGADAGKLREICNLAFLAGMIALCIYSIRRKLLPSRLVLFIGYILLVNELVYVVSGQAHNTDTERYLIMTAPSLILLLGSAQASRRNLRVATVASAAILIAVNGLFLAKTCIASSDWRFTQDAHLVSVAHYMQDNPNLLPYASMDTAIPMSYLYGSDAVAPLPLSCQGSSLLKTSTFYSKTAYQRQEDTIRKMVAIILDGDTITNTPNVCNRSTILKQFGEPVETTTSNDGSTVLLYNFDIKRKLHY